MTTKVLVVDDDYASGKTMMWAMEAMGHEVRLAQDGPSALYEVREFVPDVVLSDIKMPGMNGYELCKKLREDARLRNTLFVAQTGLASPQSQQRSYEAGYNYHLIKPVDVNELLQLVYLEIARREKSPEQLHAAH